MKNFISFILFVLTVSVTHLAAYQTNNNYNSNNNSQYNNNNRQSNNQSQTPEVQNYYIQSAPQENPYFYTLPVPTPNEAFPDDAENNAIYQEDVNQ